MRPCAQRCGSYPDRGHTVVKMKIGGASEEDRARIEAVLGELAVRAGCTGGRCQRALRSETAIRLRQDAARVLLFWYRRSRRTHSIIPRRRPLAALYPGPMATGENLFSHQDART
jgi:L-alanine-DL-glutamate epimerase-like enolase superfamily enzyme